MALIDACQVYRVLPGPEPLHSIMPLVNNQFKRLKARTAPLFVRFQRGVFNQIFYVLK